MTLDEQRRSDVAATARSMLTWVAAFGAAAVVIWGGWEFFVDRAPWAKAEDLQPVTEQIERLDKETTSLTYDYYLRQYDRQQERVWELQQQQAPPQLLEPAIRERDRAAEIVESSKTKLRSLVGVPVR